MFEKNKFNMTYPLIIGCTLVIGSIYLETKHLNILFFELAGMNDVLNSSISVSSILIGFYAAMYSILLSKDRSKMMERILTEEKNLFSYQLYSSLASTFIFMLLSMLMQIFINYPTGCISYIISRCWLLFLGHFIGSSYRTISLLLKVMMSDINNMSISTEGETEEERQKRVDSINKG